MPAALVCGLLALTAGAQTPMTPRRAVDDLLAADRTFAAAALDRTVVPALEAAFADDVVMPNPGPPPGFARGKARVVETVKGNPDNAEGRIEWAPIRGGIAADGQHGFTVGYMTLRRKDDTGIPIKYVAYWTKGSAGWRIAVYKRVRADKPPVNVEMLPPALPIRLVPPTSDIATIGRHQASLEQTERAFSDEAQKIGIGAAFTKYGSADAVNVGPPSSPQFVIGAANIGRSVAAGAAPTGSAVSWAPDEGSLVASSGDLGVTFGFIRQNAATGPGKPVAVPFITIWRRASVTDPWRYVAE